MTTAADKRWFAAVASLETCSLCGKWGVQVAHRNEGRGMGQKSKAHQTAALCPECHTSIDNGRDLSQEARRSLMRKAINVTHDRLIEAGKLRLV
ncbi:hypothetical protein [Rhodanobacter caeni]|uniref:DUF1364 domain-containing protein n=1 Tax=Rhodanobacter caeni TaxID=657654 RepID=A0ABP3EH90_9GAMM